MKLLRRTERGEISSALAVTLLSIVIGGGAATAAVVTVVSTQGPQDSVAVQNGRQNPVDPSTLIPYGG
ncbi:hypothetical protein RKE38_19050 [Phycicoccus sp. M110.8]|jgi:hypothetical protein|uniref:hypothetical protein n=1 Tax=Intrasporangiaceae TaxID=85021 RepID=UPI0028FD0B05|nr:hypothetical protein [Phycicoccus sp. M110.8]MDU0315803.1 hypothetical protein [Phycicoccus sp. M110.8]HET8766172.1 hypothetical protein [Pedococcus sp.]